MKTDAFLYANLKYSSVGKESACNAEDLGLIPGSGRSPGPTPVFLPREFQRLEEPGRLQSMGSQKLDTT